MDAYRQNRPLYSRTPSDAYAYQNIYGTVRTNPSGKLRPSVPDFAPSDTYSTSGRPKKGSFSFLPWKKNKSKGDEYLPTSNNLSKHHKYKFGSVSALSSGSLYKDWDTVSYTPSVSASDLKHASVRSVSGLVHYPWESYNVSSTVATKNSKNNQLNQMPDSGLQDIPRFNGTKHDSTLDKDPSFNSVPCKCQKKKTFGTLNLGSLKSTNCSCGFSSVRSTRGFAPPPPPRRRSILPEKVDLYAVHEELDPGVTAHRTENIYDTLSRGRKPRAPSPPKNSMSAQSLKFAQSLGRGRRDPYGSVASRKSILECDVTAYDLVKNYLKGNSPSDTDLDDDLSDNAIEEGPDKSEEGVRGSKKTADNSPSPVSSESESGVYSQNSVPPIRIGGHGMKLFSHAEGSQTSSLYSDGSKTNSVDSRTSSWSNSSFSDDGIYSLPEPDYEDDKLFEGPNTCRGCEGDMYSPDRSLRKYSSGSCLDRTTEPPRTVEESPRFSTIRKATSMVSLASGYGGENGTLRGRPKASKPPEVPGTAAPIPPPPPPPPPNFRVQKPPDTAPSKRECSDQPKKISGSSLSSSIASELSEKLRSNQPLLKKNEFRPKEPVPVNAHNPYAEVKSILKKTGESLSATASSDSSSPRNDSHSVAGLPKEKKKVQFKSLSNESLAVEQFQHHPSALSSSDEEWEEARETLEEDRTAATPQKDDGFQTVAQFLESKKDAIVKKSSPLDKADAKVASKPSSIPRPTQPPPPPPNVRKWNSKGAAPPPRSLGSASKSYSHCDLRISAAGTAKGSARPTQGSAQQNRLRARFETGMPGDPAKPEFSGSNPKNGVPSPAASLEADAASPRGKTISDEHAIYDDGRSDPSYEPLPFDSALQTSEEIYDDVQRVVRDAEGAATPGAFTCTIVTNVTRTTSGEPTEKGSLDISDEDPASSGQVFRNSLYVRRHSPSPPTLPCAAPPLPSKRLGGIILTVNDTLVNLDHYDVLPVRGEGGATVVTIGHTEEPLYSSDSIYEELPDWDTHEDEGLVSTSPFGRYRGSFFEGASKAEILRFLEGAKERVVEILDADDVLEENGTELSNTKNVRNNPIRISNISSSSESSNGSLSSGIGHSGDDEDSTSSSRGSRWNSETARSSRLVERSDSGVGSEPAPHRRVREASPSEELCVDCDQRLEVGEGCPLVCPKCHKKRAERKEIVTEIVETEFKYGKDLKIIKEEFRHPMEVAALLSRDQLASVFLNLDELMAANASFAEKLQDALDIAAEQGDEDYTTVNIGKLFLETTSMLKAFEIYCIRQGSASLLLSSLEKEKELLRIFLRVSQMENTVLRRMNLSAFLMVPVQRVTKYPLLLNRLYKVTPYHHKDREALREAQLKIELHLEQINQQTKGSTGIKIWRRISNISASHRRGVALNVSDIGSIQLRKMAMDVLEWNKEDIRFVLASKLGFSTASDLTKSRRGRAFKFVPSHALLATKGRPNGSYRPDLVPLEDSVLFPRDTGIEDATLLLVKEKNGRYSLARDPLHLGVCVICSELEDEDIIEIQEHTTKESVYLKAECRSEASEWLRQLRYHAKDLGTWKRRRNALANIMINGAVRSAQ